MSLSQLWNTSRGQLADKGVQQIIAFAGEGKLRDGSDAASEFREFLAHIPSETLVRYAGECLTDSFTDSGLALQDIVNEMGRRLGFAVSFGRYRGSKGKLGHDGLWRMPNGHAIVVEVKTTDTYRIDLNTLADYRRVLISRDDLVEERSSNLIIVGRRDTGDLEAQVRGSRHAWDIRLISVDAITRLMLLRESLETAETVERIHAILIPREFTRLDEIAELVFSTAEEVQIELDEEAGEESNGTDAEGAATPARVSPKFTPVAFHKECVDKLEAYWSMTLVKRTRNGWSSPDEGLGVICSISKTHERAGGNASYWFAFHPSQQKFLQKHESAFVAFGCGSAEKIVLVPLSVLSGWLEQTWTTEREERFYWHIRINEDDGKLKLNLKKGVSDVVLDQYILNSSN